MRYRGISLAICKNVASPAVLTPARNTGSVATRTFTAPRLDWGFDQVVLLSDEQKPKFSIANFPEDFLDGRNGGLPDIVRYLKYGEELL